MMLPLYRTLSSKGDVIMSEFNINSVFRQISRNLLKTYFASRVPDMHVNWNAVGERNVDPLFRAFKNLPEDQRAQIAGEMNDIHEIANNKNSSPVIQSLVNLYGLTPPADFSDWTLPDKSLWLILNGSDQMKKNIFQFTEIETISDRFWLVLPLKQGIIGQITYDAERMNTLRDSVSAFVFRHKGHGKNCVIDFVERNDLGEEFFFFYYDKPKRIIPQWKDELFDWDVDHASAEIVFAYNYERNELRVLAKSFDREKRTILCKIWAEVMRDSSINIRSSSKDLYELDGLLDRDNLRLPLDLLDDFTMFEVGRITIDKDGTQKDKAMFDLKEGDVYKRLDAYFVQPDCPRNIAMVRNIKFRIKLNPKYRYNRVIVVGFSRCGTDLYSKNEAYRNLLIKAFTAIGVIRSGEKAISEWETKDLKEALKNDVA